jgi:hypothetical protein
MSVTPVFYVARGRTVSLDGNPNGPGSIVKLPPDEAAFLMERGFVQTEPPFLPPPASIPNPAAIGRVDSNVNVQGPRY